MIRHGLGLWSLKFVNSTRYGGLCTFSEHTISLAVEYVQAYSEEQLTQVILHEIAHALRGPNKTDPLNSHDEKWLTRARKIGYLHGETLPPEFPRPRIVWNLTCTNTGQILETSDKPDPNAACKVCNACTPLTERRQLVKAHTFNAPAPEHIMTTRLRHLKALLHLAP